MPEQWGFAFGAYGEGSDPLAENLIKHMPYDGSLIDIVNSETPTSSGSVSYATGKTGQAIQLPGSTSYLQYTPYNLVSGKEITVALWVKILTRNASSYDSICAARTTASDLNWYLNAEGTVFKFYTSTAAIYTFGSGVTTNTWYHVAVTVNASRNLRAYVNGQLVLNTTATLNTTTPPALLVGNTIAGSTYGLNGQIDDLRLYDKAKDQAFIQQIIAKAA